VLAISGGSRYDRRYKQSYLTIPTSRLLLELSHPPSPLPTIQPVQRPPGPLLATFGTFLLLEPLVGLALPTMHSSLILAFSTLLAIAMPVPLIKRDESLCDDDQDNTIRQFLFDGALLANATIDGKLKDGTDFRHSTA
jgi:hypothetical protein